MSPLVKKLVLVAVAGAVGALALVPELASFAEPLKLLSGFIAGGAVLPRPGDVKAGQ